MHHYCFLFLGLLLTACVRMQDTDPWIGQPVAQLEQHPFFSALPVDTRRAANGVEIRNYVNGGERASSCFESAGPGGAPGEANGPDTEFCSTEYYACNNIFYIRDGRVVRYVPTSSGGAICYTDERLQPVSP